MVDSVQVTNIKLIRNNSILFKKKKKSKKHTLNCTCSGYLLVL